MRAAFAGLLGAKMKSRAKEWAKETPDIASLPDHVAKPKMKGKIKRNPKKVLPGWKV